MTESVLDIFVVFVNPADYPEKVVVRRHRIVQGNKDPVIDEKPWCVCKTVDAARAAIPQGLTRLERHPGDVLSILETWM